MANNVNTQVSFPDLSQLSEKERGMFVKIHDFEASAAAMIAELDALNDTSSGSSSDIQAKKARVSSELNQLTSLVESDVKTFIGGYIEELTDEINQVEAAYERLYSTLHNLIQSINVNIQNRTVTYDVIMSYKLRILEEVRRIFGNKSPYDTGKDFAIATPAIVKLRDTNENLGYITQPIVIDPSIDQTSLLKIFEFTPIKNNTGVPSFLAEIILSGDLFAYKGILSSSIVNLDTKAGDTPHRAAGFIADYFINQDLPFSLKVLYDAERNKVAVAFKYDESSDAMTFIAKLDCSVNLLVGNNLEFAQTGTLMTGVNLAHYSIIRNLSGVTETEETQAINNVVSGGCVRLVFKADDGFELPEEISISVAGQTKPTYSWDKDYGILVVDNVTGTLDIGITGENPVIMHSVTMALNGYRATIEVEDGTSYDAAYNQVRSALSDVMIAGGTNINDEVSSYITNVLSLQPGGFRGLSYNTQPDGSGTDVVANLDAVNDDITIYIVGN